MSKPKPDDFKAAMVALEQALVPFNLSTAAMAVSAMAGVYAAQGKSTVRRYAGIGANLETMASAFVETVQHDAEKPKRRRRR